MKPKGRSLRARFEKIDPKTRVRIAAFVALVAVAVVTFATCGACGRSGSTSGGPASPTGASGSIERKNAVAIDAGSRRDRVMWARAKEGIPEDLSTLAVHEGGIGLVEAAEEPDLRPTALRAMAHARGWAHLPYLAKVAIGKNDDEAKIALESVVDLAARERRAEDPEDAAELEEGCKALAALAKDTTQARARRVPTIRALRMMPCPPAIKAELPTDLDAK